MKVMFHINRKKNQNCKDNNSVYIDLKIIKTASQKFKRTLSQLSNGQSLLV